MPDYIRVKEGWRKVNTLHYIKASTWKLFLQTLFCLWKPRLFFKQISCAVEKFFSEICLPYAISKPGVATLRIKRLFWHKTTFYGNRPAFLVFVGQVQNLSSHFTLNYRLSAICQHRVNVQLELLHEDPVKCCVVAVRSASSVWWYTSLFSLTLDKLSNFVQKTSARRKRKTNAGEELLAVNLR